jgi:hypothetical protein
MRLLFCGAVCAISAAGLAYTNNFTLDFNAAGGTAGWTDPVPNPSSFASGVTAGTDSPAYSPTPQAATGYPGSGMFQLGTPSQANGVSLALYDGTAGGSTSDPTDYTVEADVFVIVNPASPQRNQEGIFARFNASGNSPLEFFYSHNTPGQPDGYGFRNTNTGTGGTATTYNALGVTESANRWVRMKMTVAGTAVTIAVDRDRNGSYETTYGSPIVLGTGAPTAGKAGFFSIINDSGTGALIANQFAYFDNFAFTKPAVPAGVADWSIYQ